MTSKLYYAHDPMCSWCWAFRPAWSFVSSALPDDVETVCLLGGLAPDSEQPMPKQMQDMLQLTWRNIQSRVPGTEFNFDFWRECKPRRSTYPACRAVIAAASQGEQYHDAMTHEIQKAYYLKAQNPSNDDTLIGLARALDLDVDAFSRSLNSEATHQELASQINRCHELNIPGFPTLLVQDGGILRRIPIEFNDPELQLRLILDAAGIAA